MKKVSGKTHTQEQLNAWANQNNPNNKAYRANSNNHSNQLNPNRKTHQQMHNAERRYQKLGIFSSSGAPPMDLKISRMVWLTIPSTFSAW